MLLLKFCHEIVFFRLNKSKLPMIQKDRQYDKDEINKVGIVSHVKRNNNNIKSWKAFSEYACSMPSAAILYQYISSMYIDLTFRCLWCMIWTFILCSCVYLCVCVYRKFFTDDLKSFDQI